MDRGVLQNLLIRGGLGPVRSAGREILRRIFVTVRDEQWREIAPTAWTSAIDTAGLECALLARHTSERVDFEWRGIIAISEDLRKLRFEIEGKALRDTNVCRIGLVVLHPVDSMVGAELVTVGPRGKQTLTISERIYPQPIVDGLPSSMMEPFSDLTVERSDFGKLHLRFTGDLFELEDQRNWGDASFKTYCTPLRLGFPRALKSGAVIRQALEVSYWPAQEARCAFAKNATRIGRVVRCPGDSPDEALGGWDYVQIGLSAENVVEVERLLKGFDIAIAVEFALAIQEGVELPSTVKDVLVRHGTRITRMLLRDVRHPLPSAKAVAHTRRALEAAGIHAPVYVVPNGYFVELNRGGIFDLEVDGVAFPFSPTVHSQDDRTIAENIEAVADMVAAARQITGASQVAISPLALYFPSAAGHFPKALVVPWLSAIIARAATANVTSITLARDVLEAIGV